MADTPLLPPGIHDVDPSELDNHFLSAFGASRTRRTLIDGFQRYIEALKKYAVPFEIWLDGSFVTSKEDPNDIDLVVFAPASELNALPLADQNSLRGLFDRPSCKSVFGCDVLFAVAEDENTRSYWRGWYGYDREEQPKGIARVTLKP
jgi:hypothetical protein